MRNTPFLNIIVSIAFIANALGLVPLAQSQEFSLPIPGVRVSLSPEFSPPILKGIKVNPNNPLSLEFILDQGDSSKPQEQIKSEANRLVKYFLASLTTPEKDLWVNLSPYEKDRIIPQRFGLTEMGRDLLAEDYMLKQITASLIYPEGETGKKFWKRVYEESAQKFGTTNIPVNTFNKIWIVPEKAVVYENVKEGTAYIVESTLKVMLEQDYLSLEKHSVMPRNDINTLGSQITREIVIPELTKEVNEDKNFSQLRQVYNSLILATWYKKKMRDSILEQVYADKNKVSGVDYSNSVNPEFIYRRYLLAFKKGVFNYIKDEPDPISQESIPRKYFSGGLKLNMDAAMVMINKLPKMVASSALIILSVSLIVSSNQIKKEEARQRQMAVSKNSLKTNVIDAVDGSYARGNSNFSKTKIDDKAQNSEPNVGMVSKFPSITEISLSERMETINLASQWPSARINWSRAIKDLLNGRTFIVKQNGKLVGLMAIRQGALTSPSAKIIIEGLEVRNDYQGKGIARLLVTKAAELSLANKETQGRVALEIDDESDQAFYEHLHFYSVESPRGADEESGKWYMMELTPSAAEQLVKENNSVGNQAMSASKGSENVSMKGIKQIPFQDFKFSLERRELIDPEGKKAALISDHTDLIFTFKSGRWSDWIFRLLPEGALNTIDEEEQGFRTGVQYGVTPPYVRGVINGHEVLAVGRIQPVPGTRSLQNLLRGWSVDEKNMQAMEDLFTILLKNRLLLHDVGNAGNIVLGTYQGRFAAWIVDAELLEKMNQKVHWSFLEEIEESWPAGRIKTRVMYLLKNWKDPAMLPEKNGGIDLTAAKMDVQTSSHGEIKFHFNPAMLAQLQNLPGLSPVIVSAKPLKYLNAFLGVSIVNQT